LIRIRIRSQRYFLFHCFFRSTNSSLLHSSIEANGTTADATVLSPTTIITTPLPNRGR
jgi:hypothetical protein